MAQLATEIKTQDKTHYIGIRRRVADSVGGASTDPDVPSCIGEFCTAALPASFGAVMAAGVKPMSMPVCVYFEHDEVNHCFDMLAGLMVSGEDAARLAGTSTPAGDLVRGELPAGKVMVHLHKGPYEMLPKVWDQLIGQIKQAGLETQMPCWEQYLNDPTTLKDPSEILTEINISVK